MDEKTSVTNAMYEIYNAAALVHCEALELMEKYNKQREFYKNRRKLNDQHYSLLVLYIEDKDPKQKNTIGVRIRWRITNYVNSKNKRLPRSKKLRMNKNSEYSLSSIKKQDLKFIQNWEIELFHEYEPRMAEIRKKFKDLGVMFRMIKRYMKKYNITNQE